MNCKQALRLLYDVVDNEANTKDAADVREHLKICRHCHEAYELERLFKKMIAEKGCCQGDTSQIKQRILSHLDSIEASENRHPRRSFRWFPVMVAATMAIILCLGASFWVSDYYKYQTQIAPIIEAYAAHAGGAAELDYGTDPLDYLASLTGYRLSADAIPIEYIRSVGVDTILGIEFGRIDLDHPSLPNQFITIFLTALDNYHLPGKPSLTVDGQEMFVHTCTKCSIVGAEKQDMVFLVVANPGSDTQKLAQLASSF